MSRPVHLLASAILFTLLSPHSSNAATLIGGDSIGPDSSLTDFLGGFAAVQDGGAVFGQPAIEVAQSGNSLLHELRVIVHGVPSVGGINALRFDNFQYVAKFWRKTNYLAGTLPEMILLLGDSYNVTLVPGEGNSMIPSVEFGNAAFQPDDDFPSYDFRFDLTQAAALSSPLPADTWIVAFQSNHALSSGSLLVSLSSSTTGPDPYFHQAFNSLEQHPRGILFDQDPIAFRWGMNLSELDLYADFDGNGVIDGLDFLKWQRGESPGMGSADELALWESQYGDTVPAIAAVAVVPEPSTAALLLMLMGTFLTRRQHANCL